LALLLGVNSKTQRVEMPQMWILWITLKNKSYPQNPQLLGQRKSGVDHITTRSAATILLFKKIKAGGKGRPPPLPIPPIC